VGPKQSDEDDDGDEDDGDGGTDVDALGAGAADAAGKSAPGDTSAGDLWRGGGDAAATTWEQPVADSTIARANGSIRRTANSGRGEGPLTIRQT
jgi:hypothetical protein